MTVNCFAPMEALASALIRHTLEPSDDGAHDVAHLQRVWHTARTLHATEGGDLEVLLAAVLLNDCVSVEKNSPLRSQASRLAADKASSVLKELDWPNEKISNVAHAIEAHSFSANITQSRSKRKSSRTPIASTRWACSVLPEPSMWPDAWARRCTTRRIPKRLSVSTMTRVFASIISRPNCYIWPTVFKR